MAYAERKVHTNVGFSPELHRQAVTVAKLEGLSFAEWLRRLVEKAVKRSLKGAPAP